MWWTGIAARLNALIWAAICFAPSCSSSACPTIACEPTIQLDYRTPVDGTYIASASLSAGAFIATCPKQPASPPATEAGIASCDQNGLLLSGVDLGHGSNGVVELIVTVGVSAPISVSATLDGITNSRDCSLVCYRHTGTVDN